MSGFAADERFGFTRDLDQYRQDVEEWSSHDLEDWKTSHDELVQICWPAENFIAKANFHFDRIMKLDLEIQKHLFKGPDEYLVLLHMARNTAAQWLAGAVYMRDTVKQLLAEYGTVDGYDELKANIEATQSFLTPDAEFFNSDELAEARDQAIESHRAGLTEPLFSNGYTAR